MVLRAPARRALWRSEHRRAIADAVDPLTEVSARLRRLPPLRQAQLLDYRSYLPGAILTKVDIAAMAHGLEVRTPLVDRRVVEFAATLPEDALVRRENGQAREGKHAPKELLRRWFPDAFVRRPKQGFTPPIGAWFARGCALRTTIEDSLLRRDSVVNELFRPQTVAGLFANLDRTGTAEPLWLLFFLEEWLRLNSPSSSQSGTSRP
jgi:asparagine synthase (glutamine-hydrolysing)